MKSPSMINQEFLIRGFRGHILNNNACVDECTVKDIK